MQCSSSSAPAPRIQPSCCGRQSPASTPLPSPLLLLRQLLVVHWLLGAPPSQCPGAALRPRRVLPTALESVGGRPPPARCCCCPFGAAGRPRARSMWWPARLESVGVDAWIACQSFPLHVLINVGWIGKGHTKRWGPCLARVVAPRRPTQQPNPWSGGMRRGRDAIGVGARTNPLARARPNRSR